ncbi:MAG: rod shape-determining protein RodA [Anaerolineales bacterium]|nr:rod shape-determining protein RodA [Anaerolineales bacterium]
MFDWRRWRHFDFYLLGGAALLVLFGIVEIRSAVADNASLADSAQRQATFAAIGLVILLGATLIDYHFWRSVSRLLFLGILLLLFYVELTGTESFGATRWIRVGGITIQPSEVAKISLIIILADDIARNEERLQTWSGLLRTLVLAAIPAVVILREPDLSTAILTMVLWAAMAFAAGMPPRFIAVLGVAALILPFLALAFNLMEPYQLQRLALFIKPDADPENAYNIEQSKIAIGSGGLFGQGYAVSSQVQLRFLKVRHTDFIFSVISSEYGLVGNLALFVVLGFVVYRCLLAARRARDTYGALIGYGVATLIFYQAAFNIGMNLNLLPVAGLPLPFISSGGSSLWSVLLGIGLVESTILYRKDIEF